MSKNMNFSSFYCPFLQRSLTQFEIEKFLRIFCHKYFFGVKMILKTLVPRPLDIGKTPCEGIFQVN